MGNLIKDIKITKVAAGGVSAGTAVNSTSVDMAGFEGVIFVGTMATVNAANFINAAQCEDDSTFLDLLGSKVVPTVNANTYVLDVYKPTDRYVRLEMDRGGANTAYGDIFAIQYGARVKPTTQPTTVDNEAHVSPAEGTA